MCVILIQGAKSESEFLFRVFFLLLLLFRENRCLGLLKKKKKKLQPQLLILVYLSINHFYTFNFS